MKSNILFIFSAVLLASSLSASDAFARRHKEGKRAHRMPPGHAMGGPGMGHAAHGRRGGRLHEKFFKKAMFILGHSDELNLTEKQESSIKKLMRETKKTLIRSKADVEIVKVDIMAELHEKKVNRSVVHALIDRKFEVKKSLDKKLVDAFVELKETITESQWKTLKKIYKKKKGGWGRP